MATSPRVTVIIPTYNWSNVLRYAIQTVLWQTFQDFELLVVGDGCTDDSGEVVASFNDPRAHWHNLPVNHGTQAAANNAALEMAQGEYIAYLGHDDLWHPDHLATLVNTLETRQADGAYALCEIIGPPPANIKYVLGLSASSEYEPTQHIAPSMFMHRRDMIQATGGWRDARALRITTDIEFITRGWEHGKKYVPTHQLTAFKFASVLRKNVYGERPSHEQAAFLKRLQTEPDLRYQELIDALRHLATGAHPLVIKWEIVEDMTPGALQRWVNRNRGVQEVSNVPRIGEAAPDKPIYEDLHTLLFVNRMNDITPLQSRQSLLLNRLTLPDGLYLGLNWHRLEEDNWGIFRWVNADAQLVITQPTGQCQRLRLEILPGPGVNYQPFNFEIRDTDQHLVATHPITGHQTIEIELLIQAGAGHVFTLGTPDGGNPIEGDSRILNFQIRRIEWA